MGTYISNVQTAVLLFPLLSALLSVPYAIYQYRSYGSISLWKTFLVFSFIFYLMCAYFMVILPLPADRSIVVPGAQHPQLVPFRFMRALESGAPLDPTSPASWIAFLRRPDIYTVYFNVLLTVPFGVYLRYLFHRRWWQALVLGFALTLFFEVSQVTGLFGIYEHPYRLFDVDDLITNTLGAMLGFWASIPLCHFLPDLRDVDERSIARGAAHTSPPARVWNRYGCHRRRALAAWHRGAGWAVGRERAIFRAGWFAGRHVRYLHGHSRHHARPDDRPYGVAAARCAPRWLECAAGSTSRATAFCSGCFSCYPTG